MVNSGLRELMIKAKPRLLSGDTPGSNTWVNQTSGSAGQKGGSFTPAAAMVGVAAGEVDSLVISVVVISSR